MYCGYATENHEGHARKGPVLEKLRTWRRVDGEWAGTALRVRLPSWKGSRIGRPEMRRTEEEAPGLGGRAKKVG